MSEVRTWDKDGKGQAGPWPAGAGDSHPSAKASGEASNQNSKTKIIYQLSASHVQDFPGSLAKAGEVSVLFPTGCEASPWGGLALLIWSKNGCVECGFSP